MDIGAPEITRWHREKGYLTIGYHFVIRRNGTVETGRAIGEIGAHTIGHNADSVGICMVGGTNTAGKAENNFTPDQWATLESIVRDLRLQFDIDRDSIHGHREFAPKDCPSFDVSKWAATRFN